MKDSAPFTPASRYDEVGAVRLNVSMAQQLLRQADDAARLAGYTRSGFIAQAVREKLAKAASAA